MRLRLGLAFNQKPSAGLPDRDAALSAIDRPHLLDAFAEWDEPATIDAVADALAPLGDVVRLEAVGDFPTRLRDAGVDLLFNIAEGTAGPNREAHVPAIAEFLGIPYTASDPLTLAVALHKGRAKDIFTARGLPTAPYTVIDDQASLELPLQIPYPVFLKPAWEGSSKGIAEANLAEDAAHARHQAEYLLRTYEQPVLLESYLPGDEFTVAVLGNGVEARALPLIRYRFDVLPSGALPIMGYEAKWVWDDPATPLDVLECPARVPAALAERITAVALRAYRVLGCRDWARVDLRLDADGAPQLLEVNPLPGILPDPADNSCFPRAASVAGLGYADLIQSVACLAWRRVTGGELSRPASRVVA